MRSSPFPNLDLKLFGSTSYFGVKGESTAETSSGNSFFESLQALLTITIGNVNR